MFGQSFMLLKCMGLNLMMEREYSQFLINFVFVCVKGRDT